ncbi:MAG: type VII secretion protein EssC [Lachnospiraceae bacterium]|nr:type VII secretion protein EssC [Candidatus Merdinaster equi]
MMNAILRFVQLNKAMDYYLADDAKIIRIGNVAFNYDGSKLEVTSPIPIVVNGQQTTYARLSVGDIVLIDQSTMMAVYIIDAKSPNRQNLFIEDNYSIGRSRENDLCLQDSLVSGKHCVLQKQGNSYVISDLGSTNGTIINDEIIRGITRILNSGDVIKVGASSFFVDGDSIVYLNSEDAGETNDNYILSPDRKTKQVESDTKREYPYFVRTARIMEPVGIKQFEIEAAPNIGEKPSMKMAGIAMNWQMVALSMGFQGVRYLSGKRKYNKISKERDDLYNNYLNGIEREVQEHIEKQLISEERLHPSYVECMEIASERLPRLWERRPEYDDFLAVRVGKGAVPARVSFQLPRHQLKMSEDEYEHHPDELARKYNMVADQPVVFDFAKQGNLGIAAPIEDAVRMTQSLIIQLSAMNCYTETKILCVCREEEVANFEFLKWLPHCMDRGHNIRYIACNREEAKPVLSEWGNILRGRMEKLSEWKTGREQIQLPFLVVIAADETLIEDTIIRSTIDMDRRELGIAGIFWADRTAQLPSCVHWTLQAEGAYWSLYKKENAGEMISFLPELYVQSHNQIDSYARRIAPVRVKEGQGDVSMPSVVGLLEGIHCAKVEDMDILDMWRSAHVEKSLAVPVGVTANGTVFHFDIHEKGHGPHGVVAGMTGSGKTEMVQTWITMMALQYSPEDVNFVLVDFKGSGLIEPFRNLPHLAGTISNLDKDISRNLAALKSEMKRRMELLKVAKSDILRYIEMRKDNPSLEPLPFLILVFDEFADFRKQYPEYISEMDTIFREGRSLGVYVVIMTQKPAGIITDQIRSNVNFRWCLKVQSESDSKEIINKPDAAAILNPGRAYIKTSTNERDVYELVQSFYSGGKYNPEKTDKDNKLGTVRVVMRNGLRLEYASCGDEKTGGITELNAIIAYIEKQCKKHKVQRAKQVWSEALPEQVSLEDIIPDCMENTWGWEKTEYRNDGAKEIYRGPVAVMGLIDNPAMQSTFPFEHDFWRDGNLAVYGANYTGKTVFLQTIITSLAVKYTPGEVQMFLIDGSGFGLRSLEVFPHVASSAGDDEPEVIRKSLDVLSKEIERRKKMFRSEGVGSPLAYEEATGEELPTWIVVVDNLNLLLMSHSDYLNSFIMLAREGVARGIYLVCSFSGVMGVNMQLQQNIKTSVALALTDNQDYYSIVGRVNKNAAPLPKGGGYAKGDGAPLIFQGALPLEEISDGKRTRRLREMADQMTEAYKGERLVCNIRIPESLGYDELPGDQICIGIDYDANPLVLDIDAVQGMAVSCGGREKCETYILPLLKQLHEKKIIDKKSGEGKTAEKIVYVSSDNSVPYPSYVHAIGYGELEALLIECTNILRDRQVRKKQGEHGFKPYIIAINDYLTCKRAVSENAVLRLESYVNLGAELGIFVIVADSPNNLHTAYVEGDLLLDTIKKRCPMLLFGGNISEHNFLNARTIPGYSPETDSLGKNEGYMYYKEWIHAIILRD